MTAGVSALGARLARAEVMIFDFDGTLVVSNDIKWQAFEAVFQDFPERLPEILRYCRGANHTVRGAKFRHVYEEILHRPYTQQIDAALHQTFDALTTAAIVDAPEIPGAGQFLSSLRGHKTTGVLSSTPHDVLITILERRGWRQYFDIVQGAPNDKAVWLGAYARAQGLSRDAAVFFGDTPEDRLAAERAAWDFINVGATDVDAAEWRLVDFTALVPKEKM